IGRAQAEDVVIESGGCRGGETEREAVECQVVEPAAGLRLLGGGVSTATSIAATAVEIVKCEDVFQCLYKSTGVEERGESFTAVAPETDKTDGEREQDEKRDRAEERHHLCLRDQAVEARRRMVESWSKKNGEDQ